MSRAGLAALALGKEAVMSLYASAVNATAAAIEKEGVWEAMAFGDRPAPPPIRPQDYLAILCVCAAAFLTLTFPVTTALLPVVRLAFRLWARGSGRWHRPVHPAIELLVSVAVATCLGPNFRAHARNACVKAARTAVGGVAWVIRRLRRAVARGARKVHRCAGILLDVTAPFVYALEPPYDDDDDDDVVDHDGGDYWEDDGDDDEAEYREDDNESGYDYDDETLFYDDDDDDEDEDDDTGTEHDDDARSSSEDERSDIVQQGLVELYQIISTSGAGGREGPVEGQEPPPEGSHDDDEPPGEGGGGGNDSVLEIADSDDEA